MTSRRTVASKPLLALLCLLALPMMGMEECQPLEGPGPIGELDGFPEVVFAPLTEDGSVVADVDLSRYTGLWYEVVSDVPFFEIFCSNTTAEYQPVDATTVTVLNECNLFSLDGPVNSISGFAQVFDPAVPAKLSVNFGAVPRDFGAPYWIIELDGAPGDAPYDWAVVGGPTLSPLFILTREPGIDVDLATALFERLEERGYDTSSFRYTLQDLG